MHVITSRVQHSGTEEGPLAILCTTPRLPSLQALLWGRVEG